MPEGISVLKAGDGQGGNLHILPWDMIPCREVRHVACSAGGPMEITILDVDDTKCNDCGKKFTRPEKKKKVRCPECGSENLSPV